MPEVTLNGITMHYEDVGATSGRPPLLLVAGLASDSASWMPVMETLAERFRLIMPDNRGSGRTRPLEAPISIVTLAEDCVGLLDHLGIERTHILGHSMGGMIALAVAKRRPDRVKKAVIAASSTKETGRNRALLDTLVALRRTGVDEALWHRTFFLWLFRPAFFEAPMIVEAAIQAALAYPHRQGPEAFERQMTAMFASDEAPELTQIFTETLVLCGEKDLIFTPRQIADSLGNLPNVRFEEIADAAHSLHWDQPKAFCERVFAFLAAADEAR